MRVYWLLPSLLAACTEGKTPGHFDPGKGDGARVLYEGGPATIGEKMEVVLDRRVPGYRVVSFGGTKLSIDLAGRGGADAMLVVEGPLTADGDGTAVGAGKVVAEDDDSGAAGTGDAHLDITLEKPGVYRVLAGTYEALGLGDAGKGTLDLTVACSAKCAREGIDQKAFVRALAAQGGDAFAKLAHDKLGELVHDAGLAAQLSQQLDAILADPNLAGLERFPTISLAKAVRPALGDLESSDPKPDEVVSGKLEDLLGDCVPDRSLPAELDARLPGIRYGHFPNVTLSPCQAAYGPKLGQILTSLAAGNGSQVTYNGKTATTPAELVVALVENGHSVEVRNERMYANFLSLIVGDKDLIWPVWLDTGIQLSSGESFTIPVGHSHHAWRITGPLVNTRVMFYLGTGGTAYFGQTDQRPAWSGTIASSDVTIASATSADYDYLKQTLDVSAAYLRRNRVERTTVAAGMPADGYGFLGVCNDSNATIEYATRGTTSAFPLLRAKELDGEARLDDGLDDAIRTLPKDGDGLRDRADALRRAVAMQPFPDGSPLVWDATLGAQIATARRDAR